MFGRCAVLVMVVMTVPAIAATSSGSSSVASSSSGGGSVHGDGGGSGHAAGAGLGRSFGAHAPSGPSRGGAAKAVSSVVTARAASNGADRVRPRNPGRREPVNSNNIAFSPHLCSGNRADAVAGGAWFDCYPPTKSATGRRS